MLSQEMGDYKSDYWVSGDLQISDAVRMNVWRRKISGQMASVWQVSYDKDDLGGLTQRAL